MQYLEPWRDELRHWAPSSVSAEHCGWYSFPAAGSASFPAGLAAFALPFFLGRNQLKRRVGRLPRDPAGASSPSQASSGAAAGASSSTLMGPDPTGPSTHSVTVSV